MVKMSTSFSYYFLQLLMATSISLFAACENTGKQASETAEIAEQSSTATTNGEASAAEKQLPFPVAEKFSEVEYLFEYQNDTTYVINFWATWCKPCVEELPYFEQLHKELANEKVKVFLISLDFAKDVDTKLLDFVNTRQLQPDVVALTDGKYGDWIDKVSPEWSGAIPVTYIYKNSTNFFHDTQYDSYEDLLSSVKKIKNAG